MGLVVTTANRCCQCGMRICPSHALAVGPCLYGGLSDQVDTWCLSTRSSSCSQGAVIWKVGCQRPGPPAIARHKHWIPCHGGRGMVSEQSSEGIGYLDVLLQSHHMFIWQHKGSDWTGRKWCLSRDILSSTRQVVYNTAVKRMCCTLGYSQVKTHHSHWVAHGQASVSHSISLHL